MDLFISIYVFIIGLIFGSFYNVCIIRPFVNETITKPKTSKCMSCGHPLAWYDNIPLFSYLFLLGKCRYCKTHISWQYPLVEFITAVLFLCSYLKFGISWQLLGVLIALSYFIIMSGTDFKAQVVFNKHAYSFILFGIIYGICTSITSGVHYNTLFASIIGHLDFLWAATIGAVILEIIAWCWYPIVKQRAFGDGDTYIAAGIGAFLGTKGIILTIIFAVIIQAIWAIPSLIIKYAKNKKYSEIFAMFMLIFIIVSFCIIDKIGGFDSSFWLYIAYVLMMLAYAYKVCVELINSVNLEGGGTMLPFGPALFLGATFIIFFNDKIISLLKNIEWLQNVL